MLIIREAGIADAASISRLISALADHFITPDFAIEGRRELLASMTPELRTHEARAFGIVKTSRWLLALPLSCALAACAGPYPAACPPGQQAAEQEMLYFGTERPGGRVTAVDWERFLAETVTPRFPQGFTTWPASGQWRTASGEIIHEAAWVLSLVHPPGAAAETAIGEIMASYKAQFAQEAVLRARSPACMSL